jgi:Bacterial Ig-like domain (group 2)
MSAVTIEYAARAPKLLTLAAILMLALYNEAWAEMALTHISLDLQVGSTAQLQVSAAKAGDNQWESSAPQIAQVFRNGFVVGLRPGKTQVRALETASNKSSVCVVTVEPAIQRLVDPATLKQFPDDREFMINGRKCYGSELNGQRASDPDERRFTRANRVINPKPLRADKPLDWELAPGTDVYDGAGVLIGTVPPTLEIGSRHVPVSMFNFGASKVLRDRICVYAFSVSVNPSPEMLKSLGSNERSGGRIITSAWLPLNFVIEKENLLERIGLGKARLPALPLEAKGCRITGGNPQTYETQFGELSIVRQVKSGAVPSHYLRRPSGTINLVYSVPGFGLGGQGVDSFLVGDGLEFFPAREAKVFRQPTYYPPKHPQAGNISPQTMTFIYGAIKCDGSEPVYGWMAKESLEN